MNRHVLWGVFVTIPLLLILSWLAGSQYLGISRDYETYELFFEIVRSSLLFEDITTRFETAFTYLSYVFTRFQLSNAWIYGLFAFYALLIKASGLIGKNISLKIILILFVFYSSRYFPLYEYTQIRAAIAISIAFYVFVQKEDVQYDCYHIALLFLATLFHNSAFLFFAIYFVRRVSRFRIFVAFISIILLVKLFMQPILKILSDFQSFQMYDNSSFGDKKASFLPSAMALDMFVVAIALFLWRKNSYSMKFSVFALTIGFAIYWAFIDFPVIAHRYRELTSIFALIYVIHALQSGNAVVRYFSYAIITVSVPYYIYLYFVYDPIFVGV